MGPTFCSGWGFLAPAWAGLVAPISDNSRIFPEQGYLVRRGQEPWSVVGGGMTQLFHQASGPAELLLREPKSPDLRHWPDCRWAKLLVGATCVLKVGTHLPRPEHWSLEAPPYFCLSQSPSGGAHRFPWDPWGTKPEQGLPLTPTMLGCWLSPLDTLFPLEELQAQGKTSRWYTSLVEEQCGSLQPLWPFSCVLLVSGGGVPQPHSRVLGSPQWNPVHKYLFLWRNELRCHLSGITPLLSLYCVPISAKFNTLSYFLNLHIQNIDVDCT